MKGIAWVNGPGSPARRSAPGGSLRPDTFKYIAEGGVEKAVNIPGHDGAIETMLAMFQAGNLTGVEAYAADH